MLKFLVRISLIFAWATAITLQSAPADDFEKDIKPILQKHCYSCHGNEKKKGDLDLEAFSTYDAVTGTPEVWVKVLEQIQAFEMPPGGKNELDFNKHGKMLRWLRTLPKPEETDCDKIANDRNANFYRGYVMSRRINSAEFMNTIRDLVGQRIELADLLPADGAGGEGFDNSGNSLFISTIHIEKYMAVADRVLNTVLPDKTRGLSPEAKAIRTGLLLGKPDPSKKSAIDQGRAVVEAFGRRAFRRPMETNEVDRSMKMFVRAWERGDGYLPSVRLALKSILISPNFLFLAEPEPAEKGVQALGAFPLASKLSYFLWSTMPDEELMKLAETGELLDPNIYSAQVKRMLADPKADALGHRFALQWLEIERLGTEVRPDPTKFPEFDRELENAMREEVASLFNYVMRGDRPLLELLDSDYTFVNQRLATIYDIPNIKGPEMQKVALQDKNRGGVIGMAAVHTLTSFPLRTSPVLRGRWVLEALLGETVPPPPPDVPALEEVSHKSANLSLRDQLKIHREKAECAGCHNKMDPLGFGMENFDNLGRWRQMQGAFPIDAEGTLPNGQSFTGPSGLKTILMGRKNDVMKHLVRKMTGYAYGRELNKFDECVVTKAMEALEKNEYRASVLIQEIALSFPFRHRFYPKVESGT